MIAVEFENGALISGSQQQFSAGEKSQRVDDVIPRAPEFLRRAIGSDAIDRTRIDGGQRREGNRLRLRAGIRFAVARRPIEISEIRVTASCPTICGRGCPGDGGVFSPTAATYRFPLASCSSAVISFFEVSYSTKRAAIAGRFRNAQNEPARLGSCQNVSARHRAPAIECEFPRWNKKSVPCRPARRQKFCRYRPSPRTAFRLCPRPGPRCISSWDRKRRTIARRALLCKLFRRAKCRRTRLPAASTARAWAASSEDSNTLVGFAAGVHAQHLGVRTARRVEISLRIGANLPAERRDWRPQIRRSAEPEKFCRRCAAPRPWPCPCQNLQTSFAATSACARQARERRPRGPSRRAVTSARGLTRTRRIRAPRESRQLKINCA